MARLLLSWSWFMSVVVTLHAAPRPNIIVILSDDMGYSDIGCYGGEIRTPNLDKLAKNGVRFTQFYNTARCCPTRAALLTGLYSHQAGVGHMMGDRGYDGYRGDLNSNCVTIAQVLRTAGYRTYAVGKWHVTRHVGPDAPKHSWPLQRGFDHYYGTIHGAGSYFDPATLTRDNTPISAFADPEYRPKTYYYTDALSDQAVRFLGDHRAQHRDKPFFLYVAYTAAHWPMHALPEDIAKYRGKYNGGYAEAREERLKKMNKLGLLDAGWQPAKLIGDWNSVSNKQWEAACMEVYAAMVDRMDEGIGRIIAQVKRDKQLDNTLIFYLQDNGGCAEGMGRSPTKTHPAERRVDLPALSPLALDAFLPPGSVPPQTRDGRYVLMGKKALPGTADTYMAYGEAWANVSNTPFREYKHWVHEGGISTPLIAHWPSGITARRAVRATTRGRDGMSTLRRTRQGLRNDEPGHLVDIMMTCLDVSGATYPKEFNGQTIKPLQGVSLRPAFTSERLDRAEPIFWEHEGNRAVRDGKWKLVARENKPWELYDMESDRTEAHNLTAKNPEKTRDLAAKWDAWAARADVLPLGGWRGKGSGGKPEELSKEIKFVLKSGDRLDRLKAPAVPGRGFAIEAKFTASKPDGVIIAHGGSANGYTLYLKAGKLVFGLRRARAFTTIAADAPIAVSHTALATLDASGEMTLSIDGKRAAHAQTPGSLAVMPRDGLEVGADEGGVVGDYVSPNRFSGTIESLIIEIDKVEA